MTGYEKDDCVDDCFVGFNEPDIDGQANMTVAQAAKLWKEKVLPMKAACPHIRLGSPAVSNAPAPKGVQWLADFVDSVSSSSDGDADSGIDFLVLHYYGPDAADLETYLTEAHKRFGKPVWLTEFACTTWDAARPRSEETVLAFMHEALRFLDTAPWVERYAWFGAMEDVGEGVGRANGLQGGGGLSRAGELYTSL
jgi:hypothetical protein